MVTQEKIIVTGGAGFLGTHLVNCLVAQGVTREDILVPRSQGYDLRKADEVNRMLHEFPATMVFHLATTPGGMGFYKDHPGEAFYENALMGMHLMEACRKANVKKVVIVGSALGYPKGAPIPLREEDFWKGYPGEIEAAYGLANKMLSVQGEAYHREYGMTCLYLILPNLYGPGARFDETAHVIPSMIKKFVRAKNEQLPQVEFWGDGSASREFLFVKDAAAMLLTLSEMHDSPAPLNVGPGVEVSIKNLAHAIKEIVGFEGTIAWDTSKPSGAKRRALDCSHIGSLTIKKQETDFHTGLLETYQHYRASLTNRDS